MIKKFFNITTPYTFDFNDVRCMLTLINFVCLIIFGTTVAYFGLILAVFGLVRDLTIADRRLNSTVLHFTNILINLYFLLNIASSI